MMATEPPDRMDAHEWRLAWLAMAAAAAAYLPSLWCWFVSDDFLILSSVQAAGALAHPLTYFQFGFFSEFYRPVVFLSHALDWTIWGQNAFGFHLTNVVLHTINTLLVFLLGRRFVDRSGALLAALLFGLHPASHEAVFWIAARFDLMATAFTLLALLLLCRDDTRGRLLGLGSYGLALLSKESALSLPLIVAAYDVIARRRDWRTTITHQIPIVGVTVGYALLRSLGAGVGAAGRGSRILKLAMMAAGMAALLVLAIVHDQRRGVPLPVPKPRTIGLLAAAGAGGLLLALAWPAISRQVIDALGFVTYATFFLISPVVLPPPFFVDPANATIWIAGGFVAVAAIAVALASVQWLPSQPRAVFLAVFAVAALIPVLSMPGNTRYLYLASVATSLLAAHWWRSASPVWRPKLTAAFVVILVASSAQVLYASRIWRWASEMTREGIAVMTPALEPCGTKDLLLLTAPDSIRGVWDNFPVQAFDVTNHCAPKSFRALLRVEHYDATVLAVKNTNGTIDLVVPNYRDQIIASRDLRHFADAGIAIPLRGEARTSAFDTDAGRIEASVQGDAQIIRFTPKADAASAEMFFYSDGRLHRIR